MYIIYNCNVAKLTLNGQSCFSKRRIQTALDRYTMDTKQFHRNALLLNLNYHTMDIKCVLMNCLLFN